MQPYIPNLNIVYPEKPDEHMQELEIIHEVKLDENYPFIDRSFKFRFLRRLMHLGIFTLVFFLSSLRFGLKIEGRKILKKNKSLFKNGAMTAANHIHRWDFLFVLLGVRYRMMYFPAWKENLKGPDRGLIRLAGGIPVPDEISIIKLFNRTFDEIHEKKSWIHAFPESSRFDYFQPIRPFKKGVFTMAHRYSLPVIPMAFSYRKPVFPYSIINKTALITLRIGEPLFFDKSLPRKEAVLKIRIKCHEAIVRLAGITENIYHAEGD
jgi:1-acyl-sn-glycerol-3-phosphate acyltransferase